MSNSLKTNFAHLQHSPSGVGHGTALWGRSSPGSTPHLCQGNGIPAKKGELGGSCGTRFPHQALVQDEIPVTKCPHSQGSGCWSDPQDGAGIRRELGQLLHSNSENHGLLRTAHFHVQNRAVMGFPDGSHIAMVWISHWTTLVLGFLKEAKLLFPLKCAEAHGLNGKEGELTSSTFPLFSNDLCLTLGAIQEPGGISITP